MGMNWMANQGSYGRKDRECNRDFATVMSHFPTTSANLDRTIMARGCPLPQAQNSGHTKSLLRLEPAVWERSTARATHDWAARLP
jgi:hypothetical protein